MSKTTGVDEQVLSLPKGGGDVRGLGGTFETDLNTGTGSYGIPIETPAGPNGIKPQVTLRYHSAAGNGPFGIGWTLGTMTIARKTDGRIPDYGPDDEQFVLAGVEDLVSLGAGDFRLRVDTMHARIRRQGEGWELTDVNGVRHLLGASSDSRVEVVAGGRCKTAAWLLEEMCDPNGNAVHYQYRADGEQRYLERIEWGTYVLSFGYEQRPDQLTSGRYGFLVRTGLRCCRIELHVTSQAPPLVRSWTLEYMQAEGSCLSLLQRVTHRGHAADGSILSVPPLTLEYTRMGRRTLEAVQNAPGSQPDAFAFGKLELLDWDGDGLPDLIEIGPARARIWPNRGRGRWGYPRSLAALPAPITLQEPGVAFADMDGNGTADLIVLDRPLGGFYPHRPGGGFDPPVHWRHAPSALLSNRLARLVDLNGDGISDMLVTGGSFFSLYLRDGADGWEERPRTLSRSHVPPVSFDDLRVRLADMNGDGLQDLVLLDGGVRYWPYLGNGHWAQPVDVSRPPKLSRGFEPRRLFLIDVDGDGCADIVYLDHDRVICWLNQGSVGFGEPHEIACLPAIDPDQVRLVDFKANGTIGVLWSNATCGHRASGYRYLDLAAGVKPYLLSHIDNGLGLETLVRYRPSTEFALDDADAGRPWPTFHPFPLQCVAEVEQHDRVTSQRAVTRYHYHDGRYDGSARSFLGFGAVEVDNIGDDAIPTLRTRNVYHLGLDPADPTRPLAAAERLCLSALRRRLLRTESYCPDGSADEGRPFQVVTHEFDVQIQTTASGASVLVPFEKRTLEEQWERGPVPCAFREIVYSAIDAHGNIPHQRLRVWRAGHEGSPDQDVATDATFAVNEDTHVVALPARVTQRSAGGAVLAVTIYRYDGPAHEGLPEGQVTEGNLTLQDSLGITNELAAATYGPIQPDWALFGYHRRPGESGWWVTQASYDRQDAPGTGLALRVRGARGNDTLLEYDATRQYSARLTDPRGNVLRGIADERVFQMTRLVDANGCETVDNFDALGRVIATVTPGDSDALPSSRFEYRTASLPIRQAAFHRIAHGMPETQDEYQLFTGRGELLQHIVSGEGDAGREFVVQETRQYTVRGQLKRRTFPFYAATAELAAIPAGTGSVSMRFDATGRLLEQSKPSGSVVTQAFRPGRVELVDEEGHSLVHRVDGLRRVLEVERCIDGRSVVQRYEYDDLSRLVRVAHAGGGETRLVYDLLGRVLVEHTPDTGGTVFVVDAAGNQARRTTASGKTVHMTYDSLNRIEETREEGAAAPEVRYRYLDGSDSAPPDGVQNRRGRPWQIQDRVGTLTFDYDAVGRVTETRRAVDALAGRELTTTVTYDALGRQTQVLLPAPIPGAGRRLVEYRYGARGLPVSSPGHVREAEYDVQGHLVRLIYQNGVENLLDYDLITGRPHRMQVIGPDRLSLRDQTFAFDRVGNLKRIESPRLLEAAEFGYDSLDRLTSAAYGNGDSFTYSYADNGNIQSVDGVGALTYSGPAGSGAVTFAGGQAYSYDPDGHLQSAPYGTLHFDGMDNLRRVDMADGRTMECAYDYLGQRAIRRLSTGQISIFADASVEFHDGAAAVWVTFGGRRILGLFGSGGVFLHGDLLGTPTLFTGFDGREARRLALGPYGTLRSDLGAAGVPNPCRFSGQPLDEATGLYCLGRRYYDPRLGRFISADRAVPGIYRLDAWNRYTYGLNNPLRFSDPTGRMRGWDIMAIVGVAVAVAALVVAGIFTGGATWAVAGVVINVSAVLFSTAAAMAVGAVLGGIAAAKAGGDIWKGVLFGGMVGGAAGFAGGFFGAMAGGIANSLISSLYAKLVVAGAVQGAIVGAGTGAAVGFAGGKGSCDSIWEHIWKGAAIGAVTGALLGLVSAYLTQNPYLQIGIPDKLNPQAAAGGGVADKLTYVDATASLGQGVARGATGTGGLFGLPTFVGFGSSPASLAFNLSLKVGIDFVVNSGVNYAIIAVATGTFIGLDKYNIYEFSDALVFVLEIAPYLIGVAITLLDDTNVGIFEDARNALHKGFDLPQSA